MHHNRKRFGTGGRQNSRYLQSGGRDHARTLQVRIYKTGDTYEARIIWLEHPNDEAGNPRLDLLNPDPALRSGRADAIVLVRGLRYDAKKERWTGGTIYNPVDGKVYDVQAEFDGPQELRVRGYIGKPMFGRDLVWEKLE